MKIKDMLSYFNLTAHPFTKEISERELIMLPSFEKAFTTTQLLVETRGIGLMVGQSGTGKSCVLRMLRNQLNPGLYKVLYLCHTSVGVLEFYTHLCASLGLVHSNRRAPMFRSIKEHILELNRSDRIHPIFLIDEAHFLNNDILRELRLLTNFDIDSFNALTILLCGQESLKNKLALSILEPLANSITISIKIKSLPREETFSYVEERIKRCGNSSHLFTKNALDLIHQSSRGVMRNINIIAHGALMKAFLVKTPQVEAEHVQSVIAR
ncbi:MAG: ExeA family protein [Candidatus Hodarchaeota archaeon]